MEGNSVRVFGAVRGFPFAFIGGWSVLQKEGRKRWAGKTPLTPALSPSDGERVAAGRVRGIRFRQTFCELF